MRVNDHITLDEDELEESFQRASGPGGQNVNKVSTAVELRFDARASPNLPNDVAIRLMALAGQKLTKDGVIVIQAREFRSQDRNRAEARERLRDLILKAFEKPKPRRATKPTSAAKAKRVDEKKARGSVKKLRARDSMD